MWSDSHSDRSAKYQFKEPTNKDWFKYKGFIKNPKKMLPIKLLINFTLNLIIKFTLIIIMSSMLDIFNGTKTAQIRQ